MTEKWGERESEKEREEEGGRERGREKKRKNKTGCTTGVLRHLSVFCKYPILLIAIYVWYSLNSIQKEQAILNHNI